MQDAKALLDALMGPSRNSGNNTGDDFMGKDICKHYLVGFCPNEWFKATKRELARCEKIHSDTMKEQLEAHPDGEKLKTKYENDFLRYLEKLIDEADQAGQREQRILRPPSKHVMIPDHLKPEYQKLEKDYEDTVEESKSMERCGDLGGSEKALQKADDLEAQIMKMNEEHTVVFEGEEICEVCGVRIAKGDNQWNPHLPGKLHMAYVKIREKADELRKKKNKAKVVPEADEPSKKKDEEEGDRRRSHSPGRKRGRDRRSRSRDRGGDRGRRDRRSRSRERRGDRGDRSKRSRSRSRSRRRR
eukprot:gnl/MRDRNA2_/MRDRNA2_115260_c0_seq1.p1 gnl/MRDRNA2_/MRDRNA2_115260_c0~~gnl/MRDRNA2_/MRDRNA2_115260_c0_seq1.p1  ORF type:complete len:302 (-),score=72.34 gnl/MRDRNA2_/MRDRNA2_115260_c0_seq1:33-938(-)